MNRDNDKGKVLINRSLILGIGKFLLFIVIRPASAPASQPETTLQSRTM